MRAAGGDRVPERGACEIVLAGEVRVERAVGQAGVAHHRNDRRALQTLFAQSPCGGVQNSVQRFTLVLRTYARGPSHDEHHANCMTSVKGEIPMRVITLTSYRT
jgi:hypothetical protein